MTDLLLGGGLPPPTPSALTPVPAERCSRWPFPSARRGKGAAWGLKTPKTPTPRGGVFPRGGLGTTRLSLRRKWHSQFAPGNDHPCGEPFLLRDPLVPLREREKDNLKRCQPLAICLFPLWEREKAFRTHGLCWDRAFFLVKQKEK